MGAESAEVSYHRVSPFCLMSCSRDGRPAGGGICHPLRVFPFCGLPVRLLLILGHVDGFRHLGHILDRIWFPCALRLRGALECVKHLLRLHGRARVGDRHEPDVLGVVGEPALQPFEVDGGPIRAEGLEHGFADSREGRGFPLPRLLALLGGGYLPLLLERCGLPFQLIELPVDFRYRWHVQSFPSIRRHEPPLYARVGFPLFQQPAGRVGNPSAIESVENRQRWLPCYHCSIVVY